VLFPGIDLKEKTSEEKSPNFMLRIKIGENEVEAHGIQDEVMKTFENLPDVVANIHKAFESLKPKTVATLTVKTEGSKAAIEPSTQKYPKILSVESCDEAVLRILETEWGRWRPRTIEELREAMKANDLKHSDRILTSTLDELSDKGMVKRWNTTAGFVYILAQGKSLSSRSLSR
jgi:hypothetical protein